MILRISGPDPRQPLPFSPSVSPSFCPSVRVEGPYLWAGWSAAPAGDDRFSFRWLGRRGLYRVHVHTPGQCRVGHAPRPCRLGGPARTPRPLQVCRSSQDSLVMLEVLKSHPIIPYCLLVKLNTSVFIRVARPCRHVNLPGCGTQGHL